MELFIDWIYFHFINKKKKKIKDIVTVKSHVQSAVLILNFALKIVDSYYTQAKMIFCFFQQWKMDLHVLSIHTGPNNSWFTYEWRE